MIYETAHLQLNIGNQVIEIEQVTNIDALWNTLLANEAEDMKEESSPYWAELWPSALALSHYISEMDYQWAGQKVLEIGAGLALPSIVTAKLGAEVTISDYLQEAIDFSKKNLDRNKISNAKFIQLDWRNPNPSLAADVLIAADVAYEKKMFEPLVHAFKQLCKPNGIILLAEPNRNLAKDFLENLGNQGFKIKKTQKSQLLHNMNYTINILEIRID